MCKTPAALYSAPDATDDIWIRRAAGGPEIQLSQGVGFEVCAPSWSPDGHQIVFVAVAPRRGYRAVIITLDPETGVRISQQAFRVPGIEGQVIAASFSPNGPYIALQERAASGRCRLWHVHLESRAKLLLADFEFLPEIGGVSYSIEGQEILYTALFEGHHQLFAVPIEENARSVQLTHGALEICSPQVSPSGERIAVNVFKHTKSIPWVKL